MFRDAKRGPDPAAENSHRSRCATGPRAVPVALSGRPRRGCPLAGRRAPCPAHDAPIEPLARVFRVPASAERTEQPARILGDELAPEVRPQPLQAEPPQIGVEVVLVGLERDQCDARGLGSLG